MKNIYDGNTVKIMNKKMLKFLGDKSQCKCYKSKFAYGKFNFVCFLR